MESSDRVTSFLETCKHINWFSAAGEPPVEDSASKSKIPLRQVASWKECHIHMASNHTTGFMTSLSNCLQLDLERAQPNGVWRRAEGRDFDQWVRSVKTLLMPIASRASQHTRIPPQLQERYKNVVHGYLTLACDYYQYDHIAWRSFIAEDIAQLLIAGHCVCGWDGENPEGAEPAQNGTLLIY